MNVSLAKRAVEELLTLGVREYVVCPGARNAPLAKVLSKARGIQCHYFFEERSASFFALGRIKDCGEPIGVVTTSGTAVAECLPAVIEAYYSGLPLVIVSADRPRRYRGTGAPQVIEQVGIFGRYCAPTLDIETMDEWAVEGLKLLAPFHLNICFDEPLIDQNIEPFKPITRALKTGAVAKPAPVGVDKAVQERVSAFLKTSKRPLVVLSSLPRDWRKPLVNWLTQKQLPIYAESMSHLRDDPVLANQVIQSGDKMLTTMVRSHGVDGVIRIGSVPTTRFWRDLEDIWRKLPVLSISNLPWTGLARDHGPTLGVEVLSQGPLAKATFAWNTGELQNIWDLDQRQAQKLDSLLSKHPKSELALVRALSKIIPSGSRVYLGNSLPIREWDMVAGFQFQGFDFQANRGANGIDGQLSTFLGWTAKDMPNWALVGDLTALYDLAAPWASQRFKPREFHIAIINNGGGKIFAPMFKNADFENRHSLNFADWCKQFDLTYARIEDASAFSDSVTQWPQVIEIVPDGKSTERMNEAWNKAWIKI